MEYEIKTLHEQQELIKEFVNNITSSLPSQSICILKPEQGVCMHKFMNDLYTTIVDKKTSSLDVYTDYTEKNKIDRESNKENLRRFLSSIQISISNIAGASFKPDFKEHNYAALDDKKDKVFIMKYWEYNSSAIKEMLYTFIRNIDAIEKVFQKNLHIILLYHEDFSRCISSISNNLTIYNFHKLTKEDAKVYLASYFDERKLAQHLPSLYKIVGGDMEILIKYLHILDAESDFDNINEVLRGATLTILKKIDTELTSQKKESLNYLSVMPAYLNPFDLKQLDEEITLTEIEELIDLLNNLSVIYPVDEQYYYLLEEIKKEILERHKGKNDILITKYYILIKQRNPLDYLMRAQLLQTIHNMEETVLALFILALSSALRENDVFLMKEIKYKTDHSNLDIQKKEDFEIIYNTFMQYLKSKENYKESFYDVCLEQCDFEYNPLIYSELLKNDIIRFAPVYEEKDFFKKYCDLLQKILFDIDTENEITYEKAHYASCMIVLLPHVKDKFNDTESYDKLKLKLKEIEKGDVLLTNCMKYYNNIMLRKSFMDEQLDIAIDNYNKALKFFRKEKDYREQYMTLSGLMGLYIANNEFQKANKVNQEITALTISYPDYNWPGFYKTENNRIILNFLENEDKLSKSDIKAMIFDLKQLLKEANNVSKHVVYTNLAALSLYIDDISAYEGFKQELEIQLECYDCSDVSNPLLDDFYAYYFSWFEFGKAVIQGDLKKAKVKYDSLNGFIPSIFKQYELIFKVKHKYYGDVLDKKLNGKDFALYVIRNYRNNHRSWSFIARGLMVSDLQHTSFY